MRDLYERMPEVRPSGALADAQRHLLGRGELAHPYHWAPFVLVGLDEGARETKRAQSVSVGEKQ